MVRRLASKAAVLMRTQGFESNLAPVLVKNYRLDVDDKANSAGIVVDAIRLAKIALDDGIGGPIHPACSYLMKHPPRQTTDTQARVMCEEFAAGSK